LPGMIAVGLAAKGTDGYRLPPVQISEGDYPAAITAIEKGEDAGTVSAIVHHQLDAAKMNLLKVELSAAGATPNNSAIKLRLQDAVTDTDYNGVILSLVTKYCPPGMLGLALTALLASFMSGMAGNVTAFNTVWTYDLYQAYLAPNKSDQHYMRMGGYVTFVGIVLSIGCAFVARLFPNAMDIVQLVFGFVNAPLFATFLLGMFWKRATSHGAFFGLVGGTSMSALFHGCTIAGANSPGVHGAWIYNVVRFPSEMAQNFWLAISAFSSCLILTIIISLATRRTKSDEDLKGLVYSLTEKVREPDQAWYATPAFLGTILLFFCLGLNLYFW
jgi:SSS family solute:Na+ symporter